MVDEKHKMVYCYIENVASTNWRRAFLVFAGFNEKMINEAHVTHVDRHLVKKHLKHLGQFEPKQREMIMRDYFKFMFVRDPLDRLLSAYKDRFLLNHSYEYFKEGREIFKTFRSKEEVKLYGKEGSKPIQFEEFLRWVISWKDVAKHNIHWRPYYAHCFPCGIHYDFIGKLENVAADAKYIEKIGEENFSFTSRDHFNITMMKKIQNVKQFKTNQHHITRFFL